MIRKLCVPVALVLGFVAAAWWTPPPDEGAAEGGVEEALEHDPAGHATRDGPHVWKASHSSAIGPADSEERWHTVRPGGETVCADGGDYEFYVRRGDPTRLGVFLDGGGACWDAATCRPGRGRYVQGIVDELHPDRYDGILDLDHPENPLADHTMVAVPYCTADVHLGDRDATYVLEDEDGEARAFTVHHRGHANVGSVLRWIEANVEAPRELFVAGSSGGALAAPFYGSALARSYPDARVTMLADGAGAYRAAELTGVDPGTWGIPESLTGQPGWADLWANGVSTVDLFVTAGDVAPDLHLHQVDHAHDAVQRAWIEAAGASDPDVASMIRANRRSIRAAHPSFRGFTLHGTNHTVLGSPRFYQEETNGHLLRDWVGSLVTGDAVEDIGLEKGAVGPPYRRGSVGRIGLARLRPELADRRSHQPRP